MKIILPLTLTIPRKTKEDKVFALNLNVYRNAHHMVLNQAKVMWKEIVYNAINNDEVWDMDSKGPFLFTYTVYPGTNRKFDVANVLPIIQKFTDDALIELGIIQDDNYKILPAINYRFGEVDKVNPRVELTIEPLKEAT